MSITVNENRYAIVLTEHYNTIGINFPDGSNDPENAVLNDGNFVVNNGNNVVYTV